jgi:flagellar basal body-associated protein FliL
MQLAPLLPPKAHDASQTNAKPDKYLETMVIVVLFVLLCGTIGAFVYFTLPSRDPIDLGVQTHEMQQTNFCAGRCCYPRSQPPTGKTNVFQTGALVLEIAGNKDCVQCPEYWNLEISQCPTANQTV